MIFLVILLLISVGLLGSFKCLGLIESMISNNLHKETFINNSTINNINKIDECSKIDVKYNKYLSTPVAVNVPNQEFQHTFYVGERYNNNNNNKQLTMGEGFCFPIKDFRYDSVWTGYPSNNSNDFEKIEWKDKRNTLKYYCSNNLIIKPEKKLGPGETVVSLYPQHLNNELVRDLNIKNICIDQPDVVSMRM